MELKLADLVQVMILPKLLIVPYGIETSSPTAHRTSPRSFNRTLWNWNMSSSVGYIAINGLLIVPYGIETAFYERQNTETVPFNRTLWNWNKICCNRIRFTLSFNRTLWNWNQERNICGSGQYPTFNRTLWNWNSNTCWVIWTRPPSF